MEMIASEIIDSGVSKDHVIFINLDKKEYRRIKDPNQLEILIYELSRNIKGDKLLFIEEIFNKDVKRRAKIKHPTTFNLVRNYMINNYGMNTSLNNILNELNKNGFVIGKPTLLNMFDI